MPIALMTGTSGWRLAKVATLAGVLRAASGDEAEVVATFLGGALRQRRTGLGHRSLRQLPPPAASPTLTVAEVDAAFEAMAGLAAAR